MDDYGKLWDNYSIEFNSKLVNSNGDWNKLDEDEQEIAALWKLFVDINNGGFIQFFATGVSNVLLCHAWAKAHR